jgi:hypothetical protein
MAVLVLRRKAAGLTDWTGDAWKAASTEAVQGLRKVQETELVAALRPNELLVCLVHADRAGAEQVLAAFAAQNATEDWEAGVAVFPEANGEAEGMIELARLRAKPLLAWSADGATEATLPIDRPQRAA